MRVGTQPRLYRNFIMQAQVPLLLLGPGARGQGGQRCRGPLSLLARLGLEKARPAQAPAPRGPLLVPAERLVAARPAMAVAGFPRQAPAQAPLAAPLTAPALALELAPSLALALAPALP
jgi:hypothetical protein